MHGHELSPTGPAPGSAAAGGLNGGDLDVDVLPRRVCGDPEAYQGGGRGIRPSQQAEQDVLGPDVVVAIRRATRRASCSAPSGERAVN
jgi:hypothetical protein